MRRNLNFLTSSVLIFDRWRLKVCPLLTSGCSVETKAFRNYEDIFNVSECEHKLWNNEVTIVLPLISHARFEVSHILQAPEDTNDQTTYHKTTRGRREGCSSWEQSECATAAFWTHILQHLRLSLPPGLLLVSLLAASLHRLLQLPYPAQQTNRWSAVLLLWALAILQALLQRLNGGSSYSVAFRPLSLKAARGRNDDCEKILFTASCWLIIKR